MPDDSQGVYIVKEFIAGEYGYFVSEALWHGGREDAEVLVELLRLRFPEAAATHSVKFNIRPRAEMRVAQRILAADSVDLLWREHAKKLSEFRKTLPEHERFDYDINDLQAFASFEQYSNSWYHEHLVFWYERMAAQSDRVSIEKYREIQEDIAETEIMMEEANAAAKDAWYNNLGSKTSHDPETPAPVSDNPTNPAELPEPGDLAKDTGAAKTLSAETLSKEAKVLGAALTDAIEQAAERLPDPAGILNLDEERWSVYFDVSEADEWSRKYRIEQERRCFSQELVKTYGGIEAAIRAVTSNLPPTQDLRQRVNDMAEAIAYVRGNGGPRQDKCNGPEPHSPSGKPQDWRGAPAGMTWQAAMKAAEDHCACNPFPGVNALAKLVGCSPSTMSRAVNESAKLRAMRDGQQPERTSVSAEAITLGVAVSASQTREVNPADEAEIKELQEKSQAIDRDPLLKRLIQDATDEQREQYLAETPLDELRRLAQFAYADPESHRLDESPRVRGRSR